MSIRIVATALTLTGVFSAGTVFGEPGEGHPTAPADSAAKVESVVVGSMFVATATVNSPIVDDAYNGSLASMTCSSISAAAVPLGSLVTNVAVDTTLSHTWIGDLTIKLVSPVGSILGIVSRPGFAEAADNGLGCCGSSADLLASHPLSFLDEAWADAELMGANLIGGSVVCRDGPTCEFHPNPDSVATPPSGFSDLHGEPARGAWRLCIGDSASGETGTFHAWTLMLDFTGDLIFANGFQ